MVDRRLALPDALRLVYVVDARAAGDDARLDALLAAGVTALWLRMPDATGAAIHEAAVRLRATTRRHGRGLWIGDRVDVALAVGADGVQLGRRAPPPTELRRHWPGWLGVSCHDAGELGAARVAAADHVVLSPVYDVPGKGRPLGVAAFAALARAHPGPVVALGGIGPEGVLPLLRAGAVGVAVRRALEGDGAPARASALARALGQVTSP